MEKLKLICFYLLLIFYLICIFLIFYFLVQEKLKEKIECEDYYYVDDLIFNHRLYPVKNGLQESREMAGELNIYIQEYCKTIN
jgi:hypothetical protein